MNEINRSLYALIRLKIKPVPLDSNNDSFLRPRGKKHRKLRNAARLEYPMTKSLSARFHASRNQLNNSSGAETPSLDDEALRKRWDPARCLPLLPRGLGFLMVPARWTELEYPYPTWTSPDICSLQTISPEEIEDFCW